MTASLTKRAVAEGKRGLVRVFTIQVFTAMENTILPLIMREGDRGLASIERSPPVPVE